MFTEDYLMRILNQAIAALMTAAGLRKAGKYSEADQMIEQAVQELTGLPGGLIDQMDDAGLLSMLTTNGQLDVGRLALLADLYQEKSTCLRLLGRGAQARLANTRALRLLLEAVLADDGSLSPENILRIGTLVGEIGQAPLPVNTQLALSDYYSRLLDQEDASLAAGGLTRKRVEQSLAELQQQIDKPLNTIGG